MKIETFFTVCKWASIAFMIFSVYYFGSAVIDSLPKIAQMYR